MIAYRKRVVLTIFIALILACAAFAQTPKKPKLVVIVVVDQFRYDYTTRFRKDYKGGLATMLSKGAVFTNANYLQVPTVTAVGHSIVGTGAMPSKSGIAGNEWYERETGTSVKSVCDYNYKVVGAPPQEHDLKVCEDYDPASPNRLLVTTFGDELRAGDPNSKVIGISFKARSAILPSGHKAQAAFWFDDSVGGFVSSTYYLPELPAWVKAYNNRPADGELSCPWAPSQKCRKIDGYVAAKWPSFPKWDFHGNRKPYDRLAASPWSNELIEGLAESAIDAEKLGQRESTDLLTVSFSGNDYVGHATGPDAEEVHDMAVRVDTLIGKLITLAEKRVGAGNVVFAMTADHGVAPLPTERQRLKQSGDYLYFDPAGYVKDELRRKYGEGKSDWVLASNDQAIYLNWKNADEKHVDHSEVMKTAASILLDAAKKLPPARIARVFTRDELLAGVPQDDAIGQAVTRGFNAARSGDIIWIQEPYYVTPGTGVDLGGHDHRGTTHSTPYPYDTHVPVMFYGGGIPAGEYSDAIAPNDIAPTLAAIVGVKTPSGSSGNVLSKVTGK